MKNEFSSLNLPKAMIENLAKINYKQMTPIQQAALPIILDNKDVIAQAKTGSGKTAAFGIGTIVNLNTKLWKPQILVVCPTRELATQVTNELRLIAKFKQNIKILSLIGGISLRYQAQSLHHGAHILVGTPGRIIDHITKETLCLKNIKTVVLDEADRMVEMGFIEQIQTILQYTPKEKQMLLFSATFPQTIESITKDFMNNPQKIKIDAVHETNNIKSHFYEIQQSQKDKLLINLLNDFNPSSTIIFAHTKAQVDNITEILYDAGFSAMSLHGDFDQIQRDEVLLQFTNKSILILVATDVASRGIDIKDLECVINYDMPKDKDIYTHRIGRTGRAGKKGFCLNLISNPNVLDSYGKINFEQYDENNTKTLKPQKAQMTTLCLNGGKKHKLRIGDIVGALTGDFKINKDDIGDISSQDRFTYIALKSYIAKQAYDSIKNGTIKKRRFNVWFV
jgi:ATP-independent RNA helicase DbpA